MESWVNYGYLNEQTAHKTANFGQFFLCDIPKTVKFKSEGSISSMPGAGELAFKGDRVAIWEDGKLWGIVTLPLPIEPQWWVA